MWFYEARQPGHPGGLDVKIRLRSTGCVGKKAAEEMLEVVGREELLLLQMTMMILWFWRDTSANSLCNTRKCRSASELHATGVLSTFCAEMITFMII